METIVLTFLTQTFALLQIYVEERDDKYRHTNNAKIEYGRVESRGITRITYITHYSKIT